MGNYVVRQRPWQMCGQIGMAGARHAENYELNIVLLGRFQDQGLRRPKLDQELRLDPRLAYRPLLFQQAQAKEGIRRHSGGKRFLPDVIDDVQKIKIGAIGFRERPSVVHGRPRLGREVGDMQDAPEMYFGLRVNGYGRSDQQHGKSFQPNNFFGCRT